MRILKSWFIPTVRCRSELKSGKKVCRLRRIVGPLEAFHFFEENFPIRIWPASNGVKASVWSRSFPQRALREGRWQGGLGDGKEGT